MVNPGTFRGMRREFLQGEKAAYATAIDGGFASDALAIIQRRYFKRFPLDLPHEEDPAPESLAAVDDNAPEDEIEEPSESLSPQEYATALKERNHRRQLIIARKAQIKRWMAYQYMKDHDVDPNSSGANNPYTALLHQLTGISSNKPRSKNAVNVWAKLHSREIETTLRMRMQGMDGLVARRQQVGIRGQVARELFKALPEHEQKRWEVKAQEEHQTSLKKWKEAMEGPPSTEPAARQRCIEGLVRFSQPILDAIATATGFKVTMIAGGPEPADGGRLNIISVHSGSTGGDVQVNFGRAERKRYKQQIVPIFGQFLKSCYTPEECRRRALPLQDGLTSVQTHNLEQDGATFDSVDPTLVPASSDAVPSETGPPPPNASILPPREPASTDATPNAETEASRTLSRSVSRSISRALASPPPRSSLGTPPPTLSQPPVFSHHHSAPPSPVHSNIPSPNPSPVHSRHPSPNTSPGHSRPSAPSRPPASCPRPGSTSATTIRKSARKSQTKASGTASAQGDNMLHVNDAATSVPTSKRTRCTSVTAPPRPAKRARVSSTSATMSSVASSSNTPRVIAADPPIWFTRANTMFSEESLGPRWQQLVQVWSMFEVQERYQARGQLRAEGRPQVVSDWIRRARASNWRPPINIKEHEKEHKSWWASLQPVVGGDRQRLRLPGSNGILSVIASLFYWGSAVQKSGKSCKKWDAAVEECLRIITDPCSSS